MKLARRLPVLLAALCTLATSTPAGAVDTVKYFGTDYCGGYYGAGCGYYKGVHTFMLYSSNGRDALAFQSDGNLVGRVRSTGTVWFQSYTHNTGYVLRLQDDCNVVVYDVDETRALWAAGSQLGQSVRQCRITLGGDGRFSIWEYAGSYGWSRIRSWGDGP